MQKNLRYAFGKFPYATAWVIAQILRSNYGGDENHAVYEPIENSLGIELTVGYPRNNLHEGFKTVSEQIGIDTSFANRPVDLYLAHAGVPINMLKHLANIFIRNEQFFGNPPIENTHELKEWEESALDWLPQGVRTPKYPILVDETGWHAEQFAKLSSSSTYSGSRFSQAFKQEIENCKSKKSSRSKNDIIAPTLKLIWQEDGIKLDIPKLEGRLKLKTDVNPVALRLASNQPYPLTLPWPKSLNWESGKFNQTISFLKNDNDFAVFDLVSGRFRKEYGTKLKRVVIDTTELVVVARQQFSIEGENSYALNSNAHCLLTKFTGNGLLLKLNGKECYLIQKPNRRITPEGNVLANSRFGKLYGAETEFIVDSGFKQEGSIQIEFSNGDFANNQTVSRSLDADVNGQGRISISDILVQLRSKFSIQLSDPFNLKMEMKPREQENGLLTQAGTYKASYYVWPEVNFSKNEKCFVGGNYPQNLVLESCRHINLEKNNQVSLDQLGGYDKARITFKINSQLREFEVPYPDVTCLRRTANNRVTYIEEGSRIVLRNEERFDSIVIRSPDPNANLVIRGNSEKNSFKFSGTRTVSVKKLIEHSGDDKVLYRRESGETVELFRVVESSTPDNLRISDIEDKILVSFETPESVDAVALAMEDLSGQQIRAEYPISFTPVGEQIPDLIFAEINENNSNQINLEIQKDLLPGIHLTHILIRPSGKEIWNRLSNSEGATIALVLENTQTTQEIAQLKQFQIISRWLANFYEEKSLKQISNILSPIWNELAENLANTITGNQELLKCSVIEPDDQTPESWIPGVNPLTIDPEIFGSPAEQFKAFSSYDDYGLSALSVVADVSIENLSEKEILSNAAILSFTNFAEVNKDGGELKDFNVSKFLNNLNHEQFDSNKSAGLFWTGIPVLGPEHWRAAHIQFEERLVNARLFDDSGNQNPKFEKKQNNLNRLISKCATRHSKFQPPIPQKGERENDFTNLNKWVAWTFCDFAYHARYCKVGNWSKKMAQTINGTESQVLGDIAFLIRLAPELFAFYMGMWQLTLKDKGDYA